MAESRGVVTPSRLRIVVGVVLAALALYAPFYYEPATNKVLSQAIYLAIAAMGLNLLTGFNGQVSIGHGAFFGIGAFTTAELIIYRGWGFEPTMIASALLCFAFGALIGIPALRVRGLYLALITLGLAVLFPRLASKVVDGSDAIFQGSGGVALLRPERSEFESVVGFLENDQWEYFLCLGIAVLLYVLARNLMSSRMGRAIIATRDREIAASTVGVNLSGVKVGTFAISAAYAGVAGSLSVMVDKVADATNPILYFELSIKFLIAVVIGGAATILGPALGAVVLTFLEDRTDTLIEGKPVLSPALLGIALIIIVFVLPEGLLGGIRRLVNKVSTRWRDRRSASQVNRS
jgi:branched-chain amino acid transport system permease protein